MRLGSPPMEGRMGRTFMLAAALIALPLAAGMAQAPAAGLDPAQIVAARQSAYQLSAGSFLSMKAAAEGGADGPLLVLPASALARWARPLPTMFPEGTTLPSSKALPAIWSDPRLVPSGNMVG